MQYDVQFIWMSVHGGSWHKLLTLHDLLRTQGIRSQVLLNASQPLGLQEGLDFTAEDRERLAEEHVLILSEEDILRGMENTPAHLVVFDPHRYEKGEALTAMARERHGSLTAQIPTLIGDYTYKGVDHVFLQNLLALWFMMDHTSGRRKVRDKLAAARSVHLAGNIFYEAVDNKLTTTVRNKSDLCEKYGLDILKPLCLLLPDRDDSNDPAMLELVRVMRESGMEVMVKLHPWEYKQQVHGYEADPGAPTPAEKWGVKPLEERDASWAMRFANRVICRGSAVGLEVPYYEKPLVWVWPEDDYRSLLTRSCSLRVPDPGGLAAAVCGDMLAREYPKESYASAISEISAVDSGQSFEYHAQGIQDILEGRVPQESMGDIASLRELYLGKVPWPYLRHEHWPEHGMAKLLNPFRSAEVPDHLITTPQGLRFSRLRD